jgi:hypothetical protein
MRPVARVVTVLGLLAVAVVTATTGVAAAAASPAKVQKNQSNDAKLNRALHAWAGFPVGSSPRRLVLLQGYVLNPEYGFGDDNGKEAFLDGDITAPATWPASPASSTGFPIVGAAAAFKTLTTPSTNSLGTPPPLATSGVQLGSGLFLTDRGWRVLPAWLYSLTGVQNPAKVLAVAASALYSAPITRGGMSPSQMSATVSPNGRQLVATFVGDAAGTGPCTAGYTLSFKESKQAVALLVIAHPHGAANGAAYTCTLVGYSRHATVGLKAPLGKRVVVDATSEGAMAVTRVAASASGGATGG